MNKYYVFIALLGVTIVGLLIAGFMVAGTPINQRLMAIDQIRTSDFSTLQNSINEYYRINSKLPDTLQTLPGTHPTDPESKQPYSYASLSATTFKLCATFSTDSTVDAPTYPGADKGHKKGYDCVQYTIPDYVLSNTNDLKHNEAFQKQVAGVDFDSLVGKEYFIKEATFTTEPKAPPPNNNQGILNASPLSFHISSDSVTSLYEIKDNPKEYFLALYTYLDTTIPSCKTKSDTYNQDCVYVLDGLKLLNENGKEIRRNIRGIKDYVDVSVKWNEILEVGRFNGDDINLTSGALGFFLPVEDFANPQKQHTYSLSYNNGQTSSSIPLRITIRLK